MTLLRFLDTTTLKVVTFANSYPGEYAILFYTWSQIFDELAHLDVDFLSSSQNLPGCSTAALHHLAQACRHAQKRKIPYLWVDALCVDQTSSASVNESVTASFRLVWNAAYCIAYLSDLSPTTDGDISLVDFEVPLSNCRWFTRGWTLQELIASRNLEFFDCEWNSRGTKTADAPRPWVEMLSRVSGVDTAVLVNRDALFDVSLGRRISWAARRRTSRPEDIAYSLIGICGLGGRLTPRYGEGGHRAFQRLQQKILKSTSDLSILAWKRQKRDNNSDDQENDERQPEQRDSISGALADSVSDFEHFASNKALATPFMSDCEISFNNRGLNIRTTLSVSSHRPGCAREVLLVLNASWRNRHEAEHIGILLNENEPGLFVRSNPGDIAVLRLGQRQATLGCITIRCDVNRRDPSRLHKEDQMSQINTWMDEVSDYATHSGTPQTAMSWAIPNTTMQAEANDSQAEDDVMKDLRVLSHESTTGNTIERICRHAAQPTPRIRESPFKRSAEEMSITNDEVSSNGSEDDVLLFDSLPEKPELLEENHHFHPVLPNLVTIGLRAWNDAQEVKVVSTSKNKQSTNAPKKSKTSGHVLGTLSIPFRQRTQARIDHNTLANSSNSNNETRSYTAETDLDEPDMVIVRQSHETGAKELLACPFYRLDPERYHSCMWQLELPDIRTLKQHVIVDHRLPEHCPVCQAVFDSATERDRHIVERSCTKRQVPPGLLVGVSEDKVARLSAPDEDRTQERQVAKRLRRRQRRTIRTVKRYETLQLVSVEQRWFRVWDILFPDVPSPGLPRLTLPLEHEVASLRNFWRQAGPELLSDALKERGLLKWEDLQEEAALAALHASVLEGMVKESGILFHTGRSGHDGTKDNLLNGVS